jgi:hypothetical protein
MAGHISSTNLPKPGSSKNFFHRSKSTFAVGHKGQETRHGISFLKLIDNIRYP